MYLTTKSGRKVWLPDDKEDAEINAQIAADLDDFELTGEDFQQMRPAAEVLPELFGAAVAAEMLKPKGGRPKSESPKVFTGIRLDAEVLAAFRATGKGWHESMTRSKSGLRNTRRSTVSR